MPSAIEVAAFLTREAIAMRNMVGLGCAPVKREGYPDIGFRNPAQLDAMVVIIMRTGRVPKEWPT